MVTSDWKNESLASGCGRPPYPLPPLPEALLVKVLVCVPGPVAYLGLKCSL